MARSLFSCAEITNGENCTKERPLTVTLGFFCLVLLLLLLLLLFLFLWGLGGCCCCCFRHGIKIITLYNIQGEKDNI